MKIIIATVPDTWNIRNAERFEEHSNHDVYIITARECLTMLNLHGADWVFFPHWQWMIDKEIVETYRCVIFHTSPLPYGRGGSPIQNQIVRGRYQSELCAIRANAELDQGPVYMRWPVDLSRGTAEEILIDISDLVFQMIPQIIDNTPALTEQVGEPLLFERRQPWQSEFPYAFDDSRAAYDFIRMLDGEGYPKAYMEKGNMLIEFSNARRAPDGAVVGAFRLEVRE